MTVITVLVTLEMLAIFAFGCFALIEPMIAADLNDLLAKEGPVLTVCFVLLVAPVFTLVVLVLLAKNHLGGPDG